MKMKDMGRARRRTHTHLRFKLWKQTGDSLLDRQQIRPKHPTWTPVQHTFPHFKARSSRSTRLPKDSADILRVILRTQMAGTDKSSPPRSVVYHEMGHPPLLPGSFVEDVSVEMQFLPEEKIGITVSKGLLVIKMEQQSAINKLFLCDFITHINGKAIDSKKTFYAELHSIKKKGNNPFSVTVRRPVWNTPTNNLPTGYDRPAGYQYFTALFVLYPGSSLGIAIKAYNSKVYVSHTEQNSLSASSCYIGDCIVAVGGIPVTGTSECSELLTQGLTKNKFVTLTIERAVDDKAVRAVRIALVAEKTARIDPLMSKDCMDIGSTETERFQQNNLNGASQKGIYKSRPNVQKKHVSVAANSSESPIGADPYNPMMMQKVPGRDELAQRTKLQLMNKQKQLK